MSPLDRLAGPAQRSLTPGQRQVILRDLIDLLTDRRRGGLWGLVRRLEESGLAREVASWIRNDDNLPLPEERIEALLGGERLRAIAEDAGAPLGRAAAAVAELLPGLVDRLTPAGRLPDPSDLRKSLARLRALSLVDAALGPVHSTRKPPRP